MDERELRFDREKHVCYSKAMKQVIRTHLRQHYGEAEAEELWEQIQRQYVAFLEEQPYLGGAKCTHNGAGGTYDCIAVFAYYEVLPDKPTLEELYEMLNAVLLPPFRRLGRLVHLSHPLLLRICQKAFVNVAARDRKLAEQCPTGYLMEVEPYDPGLGIRYRFRRCPIAEFAKAHGYLHLMPAFCNGDYPAMEALHAGLIREFTCANGPYCDYWIVGENSSFLQENPRITDETGYFRNISQENCAANKKI